MGETILEQAARDVVDNRCADDEGFAVALFQSLRWWKRAAVQVPDFIEAIVQKSYLNPVTGLTIYDAYFCSMILAWFDDGLIARALVDVGATPFSDIKAKQNQQALSTGCTLGVTVRSGQGDNDGNIVTRKPYTFYTLGDKAVDVPSGTKFPLEIGTTCVHATWWHLLREGRLARWPYGHSLLHLWYAPKGLNEMRLIP